MVAAHRTQVESVDWSPSGHRVVTGDREGVVRIWSPDTLETFHDIDIGGGVKRIRWSPRGDTIATANIDGGIQVYSAETGSLLATLPSDQGWRPALRYLPDGRLLMVDGSISAKGTDTSSHAPTLHQEKTAAELAPGVINNMKRSIKDAV